MLMHVVTFREVFDNEVDGDGVFEGFIGEGWEGAGEGEGEAFRVSGQDFDFDFDVVVDVDLCWVMVKILLRRCLCVEDTVGVKKGEAIFLSFTTSILLFILLLWYG